ncbi:hypothetical protein PTNB73_05909 [Pyrenophora teres f. teres]|nr:hypothetical protein PTNB85_08148 [Pyrenophora teres f. teres]KAE8830122.1 hypothetical protein HRS9139_06746 [Pyrenophora teres f. teres]KAE8841538.1 hypothetical protein HRS9122_05664 [Pyrenophora teres f. teres]KAE8859641.1 hypothetical protein PTNB29_06872 [Pyrenophora teres f. teres]KAE8865021.1 hypothetical protein PTNB73_05909 [Pyrenophora teres f. teres]
MTGFPSLQPAFTVRVNIDAPMQVGGQSGPGLVIVPMVSGTIKSEGGFEPKLDGELHGVGYDYIHNDTNGGNMRLDVRSQVKTADGTILAMYYKGTVALTPGVVAMLSGSPDAKTTDYGDSFVTFSFETGSDKYKDLQNGTYVAAGHFVKEGGGVIVEYKFLTVSIPWSLLLSMSYKKEYTLDDFRDNAQDKFPDQFPLIANITAYKFEKISYTNGDGVGQQADMLSIGHYYKKSCGPTVWAHTQGLCIQYYYGKSSDVCAPVPDAHRTRIYYHEPFKLMGSTQGCAESKRNLTVGRKYEQAVFDTVVYFVFLLTGHLMLVSTDAGTDMLDNLRFACMNLAHKLNTPEQTRRHTSGPCPTTITSLMEASNTVAPRSKHSRSSSPTGMSTHKRTRLGSHSPSLESSSPQISRRSAILDQASNYNTVLDTPLTDKVKDQEEELQVLRARLDAKGMAYNMMKSKYKQEKARRQAAEAENETWKHKSSEMEEWLQQSQDRRKLEASRGTLRGQVRAIKARIRNEIINAASPRETTQKQDAPNSIKPESDSDEEETYIASLQAVVFFWKTLRSDIDHEYERRILQAKEGRQMKLTKPQRDEIYLAIIEDIETTTQIQIRPRE